MAVNIGVLLNHGLHVFFYELSQDEKISKIKGDILHSPQPLLKAYKLFVYDDYLCCTLQGQSHLDLLSLHLSDLIIQVIDLIINLYKSVLYLRPHIIFGYYASPD